MIKVCEKALKDILDKLEELKDDAKHSHYQYKASLLGQSLETSLNWEIDTLKEMLGIEDND